MIRKPLTGMIWDLNVGNYSKSYQSKERGVDKSNYFECWDSVLIEKEFETVCFTFWETFQRDTKSPSHHNG